MESSNIWFIAFIIVLHGAFIINICTGSDIGYVFQGLFFLIAFTHIYIKNRQKNKRRNDEL